MAKKEEFRLQPTKSEFLFRGEVVGINNDNAYFSGTTKNGGLWHRIRFGVKTSPTNILYVELIGVERDVIYAWDARNRKAVKFPWDKRFELPDGHTILSTRISTSIDKRQTGMTEFDAIDEIRNNINDGDFVEVRGEIQFNEYINNNGDLIRNTQYVIRNLKVIEKFDMTDPDFNESNEFTMEAVVIGTDYNKDLNKVFINVYTIQYGDKFTIGQLVVDGNENQKFAYNVSKRLREGDWIKVTGVAFNAVEIKQLDEVENEKKDYTQFDEFGGQPSHTFDRKVITNVIRELRVRGIPVYEPKKYNIATDFVKNEAEETFSGSNGNRPFSSNTQSKSGYDYTESEWNEENDDDDIPF